MDVFYGTYTLTVDSTGRFVLPADLRNQLGHSCTITKGTGCLWMMTSTLANQLKEELGKKATGQLEAMFNSQLSILQRHIFSGMTNLVPEVDRNMRITLTHEQKRYANIDKTLILCGVGSYIEIWNPADLDIYHKKYEKQEELFSIATNLFQQTVVSNNDQLS